MPDLPPNRYLIIMLDTEIKKGAIWSKRIHARAGQYLDDRLGNILKGSTYLEYAKITNISKQEVDSICQK